MSAHDDAPVLTFSDSATSTTGSGSLKISGDHGIRWAPPEAKPDPGPQALDAYPATLDAASRGWCTHLVHGWDVRDGQLHTWILQAHEPKDPPIEMMQAQFDRCWPGVVVHHVVPV